MCYLCGVLLKNHKSKSKKMKKSVIFAAVVAMAFGLFSCTTNADFEDHCYEITETWKVKGLPGVADKDVDYIVCNKLEAKAICAELEAESDILERCTATYKKVADNKCDDSDWDDVSTGSYGWFY